MTSVTLNWVDYAILGVLLLSVLLSLARGFVHEILALIVWALGVGAAFLWAPNFETILSSSIGSFKFSYWLAFVLIFIAIWIVGLVVSALLRAVVQGVGLGIFDRLFGAVFGFVRGVLIVAVLLIFINYVGAHEVATQQSSLAHFFTPLVHWLGQWIPDSVHKTTSLMRG